MDASEIIVFIISAVLTLLFLVKWYQKLCNVWPPERAQLSRYVLMILPGVVLGIFLFTLSVLASFDVVGEFIYMALYVLLGFAWLYMGIGLISMRLDISWVDDVIGMNNKAALLAVTAGILAITLIYSGANIGDGPGWWCVVFAGGLGTVAWFILAAIVSRIAGTSEHITVDRDIACGIRFGSYLLASGIILARASAGDWTSFSMTLIEFADGWPAMILAVFAIIVELLYIARHHPEKDDGHSNLLSSIFWGMAYIVMAILAVMFLPELRENPAYGMLTAGRFL